METRLYIGNMSFETTEQDLRTMFEKAGSVGAVDIIIDRQTGNPKGFGFVTMSSEGEAEKGISLFDGKEIHTRTLKVNLAKPRVERSSVGGG